MQFSLPEHYHTLAPFREFFGTGVPILMYHKIGPRPRKARLKGLYVTPANFVRQLTELTSEGFASCSPGDACADGSDPGLALP